MESGAKGCEVVVSGKLRGQRAKSMKFVDGLMIHSGEPTKTYVDFAVRHVYLRQGWISICDPRAEVVDALLQLICNFRISHRIVKNCNKIELNHSRFH